MLHASLCFFLCTFVGKTTRRMNIWTLLYHILRYVMPYRWLVTVTLILTLIGSLLAQVNAIVLDRAVDAINVLDQQPTLSWPSALRILIEIGHLRTEFCPRPAGIIGMHIIIGAIDGITAPHCFLHIL